MLLIISGPSGSGKTTLAKKLCKTKGYQLSVSVTTREKRPMEEEGVDYFYITKEDFINRRNHGELLEYNEYSGSGNGYGTPKPFVAENLTKGNTVVLEIDVNGMEQVKKTYPYCVTIFIIPPTLKDLRKRLVLRGEAPESIEKRLRTAEAEINRVSEYDYLIINGVESQAFRELTALVEKIGANRGNSLENGNNSHGGINLEEFAVANCGDKIRKYKGEK